MPLNKETQKKKKNESNIWIMYRHHLRFFWLTLTIRSYPSSLMSGCLDDIQYPRRVSKCKFLLFGPQ